MNPISSLFFLLPLTLCITLHPHLIAAGSQANASATPRAKVAVPPTAVGASPFTAACARSTHKDFCLTVLQSDPTSKTADLKGLAFIAFKLAAKNATSLSVEIKSLLNDTATLDPTAEQGLTDCSDRYMDVVDQINDAMAALSVNAFRDVDTWVKVAIADIDACEGGIKGQTGPALEVSRKNHVVRQYINTALSIVHIFGH